MIAAEIKLMGPKYPPDTLDSHRIKMNDALDAARVPVNNYVPDFYVKATTDDLGTSPAVPDAVVLYITDFCPAAHSQNQASGHCQKPQLDLATSAFLLLSQQNAQGYIDSQLDLLVELLPEDDITPAGPQYSSGPNQSQTSVP